MRLFGGLGTENTERRKRRAFSLQKLRRQRATGLRSCELIEFTFFRLCAFNGLQAKRAGFFD
jgi:hypothetical protein